ncbi:hypothetical protein HanIR_Chr15g0759811 [Helianthus annuus]|nr:hypothetical protein HanIR_Chr15g0759811 [Helianthus annuus]
MVSTTCGISPTPLVSNIVSKPSTKSACSAFFPHSQARNRLPAIRAQAGNDSSIDVQVSDSQNKDGAIAQERRPLSTISPFGA